MLLKTLPFQRLQILQFCQKLKGQPEKEIDESDKDFSKIKPLIEKPEQKPLHTL